VKADLSVAFLKAASFLFILSFGIALPAVADDQPRSLLSNGDFQSVSSDSNWPQDWPRADGVTFEQEEGQRFLRLHSSKPGQMILVYRQMPIPSPRPAALEVCFRVRYADIKPGEKSWYDGRIICHFKNRDNDVVKPEPPTPSFHGGSDKWVERDYFVKVPGGAKFLEVMPCLFHPASGTLEIAKFAVFAATADKLPKPPPVIPSALVASTIPADRVPPELHVVGNELQSAAGKTVWLQGLCVDSMEWSGAGEHIEQSIVVAIDQWKANVIRLPVTEEFWFGRNQWQHDGGIAYRKLVDAAIDTAAARGGYLALDLHRFGAPMPAHKEFWTDAATRYKNRPEVIFELFNEAHGVSWKTWRDGGSLKDPAAAGKDANAAENSETEEGETSVGMQALLGAIRAAGARNPVIAGGLDWGYDLSGVTNGFALKDDDRADGVIYSSHIYPWKKDWRGKVLLAAEKYPIFVGEIGCPLERMPFIPPAQHEDPYTWAPDALGFIQKYKLNWTGFSFHPKCAPMVISDWRYTPTPYWGAFVKDALSGKAFLSDKMR
jgi:hypothetical protein